jgi:guanylate kinase
MPTDSAPLRNLIVISAPSGGGKSTVVCALRRKYPSLLFSVSATTRPRRPGEVDGREYFFLTKEEFRRRVEAGDLVEWEEIYGDYYGTLKSEVDRAVAGGRVMLFDVDVKGGLSIKRMYGESAVLIFLEPPSLEVLQQRLRGRRTESEEALAQRMARVQLEIEQGKKFDYQIVNDELARTIAQVDAIVRTHAALPAAHNDSAEGG